MVNLVYKHTLYMHVEFSQNRFLFTVQILSLFFHVLQKKPHSFIMIPDLEIGDFFNTDNREPILLTVLFSLSAMSTFDLDESFASSCINVQIINQ